MEFNEFVNKLINKINNWGEVIDFYDRYDNRYVIYFPSGKDEYGLDFNIYYKDFKLIISIYNNDLYIFDINEREYKRFVLNIEEAVHYHNKQIFDKFLEI